MDRTAIVTTASPGAVGPYSQAIDAGALVFCSGVIGLDPATGILVEGGIEAETERVMTSLGGLLAAAGLGYGDIVKTTCFLADIDDFATFNGIYGRYMTDPPPARSTFAVAALPKGARVEVEAIAVRRSSSD